MVDEGKEVVLRPWTIKSMPEEWTSQAVAYARRHQMAVAEVVSEALKAWLGADRAPSGQTKDAPLDVLYAIARDPAVKEWVRKAATRQLGQILGGTPPRTRSPRITVAVKRVEADADDE